jgi:hypothetical protein
VKTFSIVDYQGDTYIDSHVDHHIGWLCLFDIHAKDNSIYLVTKPRT